MKTNKSESDKLAELRKRAEARLKQEIIDTQDMSPEEVYKLVHDLRTHQIELEMQNEELRRAQDELVESRDKYSDLYDFAPVGYVTVSRKGLILEANLTLADILGVERRALLKQPFSTFIIPEDTDIFYHHHRKILESKQRNRCRLRMLVRNSDHLWVEMDSILIEADHETDARLRTAVIDITGRKRAEDAIQESEERFRLSFENANDGACLVGTNGKLLRVNKRMCDIFGYSKKELERMTVNDIAHPEDKDISPTFIKKSLSGEIERTVFEKRYLHKQGHTIWGQVSSSLIRNSKGTPLYFISHVQDITERIHLAEEKEELISELRGAFSKINTLKGFLPICASCKKIRDDKGYWNQIETYIRDHSEAQFSHGICPECSKKLYPDLGSDKD